MSPSAFGRFLCEVKPRLPVSYHSILVPEMLQYITEKVRVTDDRSLAIPNDLIGWNISKDSIQLKEVIAAERVQPPPTDM